ncbi:MAG: fused tRNA nucleotidyltransferase/2',3'-cyclic phosphodiesterase/2' nucleotidase and phosphatase [Candidatus Westeberhardia cardiocondylae]|nr:fused tRNA nucleotidyltransferase/2',3'-cyclic phosphodiesterase/2' nucleotidase and phosphatase [Candidatus Westeberhardia cardiocondylae]
MYEKYLNMKVYLVGGAVRDFLLKIPVIERDWVVIGSTPKEMLQKGYRQVGKGFPVFLHPDNNEEYALARIERKSGIGHTGFFCSFSRNVSLEEDLVRRDLTINAIACDKYGHFIDPCNGIRDIFLRKLRHISNAFCEDPLRVLRVARFAARFFHLGFSVDPDTLLLMKSMKSELTCLSSERIWKETEQALMTNNPHIFFQILYDCGVLNVLFPELYSLFNVSCFMNKCEKVNFGVYTLNLISIVSKLSDDISVRFSSICYHFGKSISYFSVFPGCYNIKLGTKVIEVFCKRLKIPVYLKKLAKISERCNSLLHISRYLTSQEIIYFFNSINVWNHPNILDKLIMLYESDMKVRYGVENCVYFKGQFLKEAYKISSVITAREMMKEGFVGKDISDVLNCRRINLLNKWRNI